jgi:TolB-like protein/tetratricopeptide (TPR) repeat protein
VVAIAALTVVLLMRGNEDPGVEEDATRPALAVLPFTTLGDDPQNDYLGDGLTEDLINHLANLPGLQVVASTSAFAFKDRAADVRDIARELGVRHVLQGSVRKDGDRVRITAALTDAGSGLVQWSRSFDTAFSDIFSVQDEISKGIVDELGPRFGGRASMPEPVRVQTQVMPAYERVLRGRHHLRSREEASLWRSIELFSEAIGFDPHFGEAYRDLARAYALLPTYSYEDPVEMFDLAEAALEQGVAMDPSLDEKVYDVRAFLHYSRWEWSAAEEDFRRALKHAPNDPNLHQWYSQQLAAVGKPELALEAVLQAKALDVLSPTINQRLAVVYQWVDEDEKAYQQFELARELGLGPRANPESYVIQLLRRGDYATARELLLDLQRAFRRASQWVGPFIAALEDPAARPDALDALRAVADERQISVKYLQGALVYLGDADGALEVAFELLNEPLDFEVEFLFARENAIVRQHPRFGELVRAIGLDEYWDTYGWPDFCDRDGDSITCH